MAMPLYQARGAGTGGRRATAQDAGGGAGQVAIAEGLSNLNEVGAKITDAVYTTRAARGLAQAASRIDEAVAELDAEADRDPTIDQDRYTSEYERRLSEIADEEGEDLPAQYRDTYDQKLGLYGDRGRLTLTAQVQKKQINQSKAYFVETLRKLATEESRARTPAEKAEARKEMVGLTGKMRALGLIDDAEMFKASHDYQETVWMTALNEGLAGDEASLQVLRLRVELSDGPFADMPEEKRQAAMLTITRREEALARAAEIKVRFDTAEGRRLEAENARTVTTMALQKAASKEGLTFDDMMLFQQALEKSPGASGMLWDIVKNGGHFIPTEPEPGYFGRLKQLETENPKAYAELPIGPNQGKGVTALDPKLLGTKFDSEVVNQKTVREKGPATIGSNITVAVDRWNRLEKLLADVPLLPWSLKAQDQDARDAAFGDYRLRVDLAVQEYRNGPGKGKDPTGPEFVKVLDQVMLDLAERYGDERIGKLQQMTPELDRPAVRPPAPNEMLLEPPPTRLLEGISSENLKTVKDSLKARGYDSPTPEQVRQHYDAAVAAGIIEP